jgi:hypothetical protein
MTEEQTEVDGAVEVDGVIHPGRVLEALGAIGYTPESAICDIVDNSITHGHASKVWIKLEAEPGIAENRRNSASRYIIADNGSGLDAAGLSNALALGSDPPKNGSLGKFGMGLKSAGLSQGKRITVLSKTAASGLEKRVLDIDYVTQANRYVQLAGDLTDADLMTWEELLADSSTGTIVIVDKTYKGNQPSIKATRGELHLRLGVIYYYFLHGDNPIAMHLDGEDVKPFDPLFIDEANENGDLDEKRWDGRTTRWLSHMSTVTIDAEANVTVDIEMTQLPHPPTFETDAARIRSSYLIGAGNYGFYIYRNKRLIAWGERFTDIVPLDQDYYSFRGRILIDDSADDVLNIDVKKSRVLLSDEARSALTDYVLEPRVKSRDAWRQAGENFKRKLGVNTQDRVNERLSSSGDIEVLPSEPDSPEIEERRKERRQHQEETTPVMPEERAEVVDGAKRVLLEEFLRENVVWERAYDATIGTIVRINGSHRFTRHVLDHYGEDFAMTLILNALFLCLARTESYAINNMERSPDDLEELFAQLRHIFSEQVANVTQEILEPALTGDVF